MEKWLEAFAKGLLIHKDTEEGSKTEPASEEQIEAFKKAFKSSVDSQIAIRDPGYIVTYDYRRGKIRGRQRWQDAIYTDSPNGNLASVLSKLPKLPSGESYTFPTPTCFAFRVKDACRGETEHAVVSASNWIQQNFEQ